MGRNGEEKDQKVKDITTLATVVDKTTKAGQPGQREEEQGEEGTQQQKPHQKYLVGDLGIMLDTRVRGKGYAVEVLRIMIDYGFGPLGLDECRVAATDQNVAMRGLMEKRFGLVGERIEKDQFENEWIWRLERWEWVGKVGNWEGGWEGRMR